MRCTRLTVFAVAFALGSGYETGFAGPLGTAFTYQGQLKEAGSPANGEYDFILRLFNDPVGGAQVGDDLEIDNGLVSDGLFTLELDFGTNVFTGDARWLQVSVRPGYGGGEYTDLAPRQPLNATPYALYALSGPGGSGGYWAGSGANIYATNPGNIGVGTTAPLDKLHLAGPAANLRLQDDDDPNSYAVISDTGKVQVCFEKRTSNGSTLMDLTPMPLDGVSGAAIRVFRSTNTTGPKNVYFYRGNNTTSTSAGIGVDGADSYFQVHGGKLGIGTTSPIFKLDVQETDPSIAAAVSGHHTNGYGVKGASENGIGVIGLGSQQGVCGWGSGDGAIGVFGVGLGQNTYAGYFNGRGYFGGDLGVNVQEPEATLDVLSFTSQTAVRAVTGGTGVYGLHESSSGTFPGVWGATNSLTDGASGVRGFVNSTSPGTDSAGVRGHNNGTTMGGYGVHGSHAGYGIGVYGVSANGTGVYGESTDGAGVYGKSTNGYAGYFDGRVSATVLEITGADLAEKFPVSEEVQPGMVGAIDPDNPGQLRLARGEYNRLVAGVVSGAGDIPTGAVLGNLPGCEHAPPIALSGRVWVWCDATEQSIAPGDLLTTAARPGHAMKVTDYQQAQGAALGKAMTALKEGTGLVLVLVNPQ